MDTRLRRWGSIVIPIASLAITFVTVTGSLALQFASNREQSTIKLYEVTFKPKQEAYSSFMTALVKASLASNSPTPDQAYLYLDGMEFAFYSFQPFLSDSLGVSSKAYGLYRVVLWTG